MEKIKQNKIASLLIILLIYIVAVLAAVLTFLFIDIKEFIFRLLVADIVATAVVYLFGVIAKNSSVYDPYWSVAPPILLIVSIIYFQAVNTVSFILLTVVIVWSIRLTANWVYTFNNLKWQDWRYTKYKNETGKLWQFTNFFGINLMPTLIVFSALASAIYCLNAEANVTLFTYLAALLCLTATLIELVSDTTMHRFRKDESNKNNVCQVGLYKYSRHPNYLGEITFWWGIYFIALSVDINLWWTGFGALINTALFVFISIPLMEKRQIQRRPEYKQYIETTSMLLLLPPKNDNVTEVIGEV